MSQPEFRDFDWTTEVKKVEGKDFYEKPVVYEFNGGERVFKEEDPHGPYAMAPAP